MGSIFVISLKGKAIPQSGAFEKMLAKMSLVKRLEAWEQEIFLDELFIGVADS